MVNSKVAPDGINFLDFLELVEVAKKNTKSNKDLKERYHCLMNIINNNVDVMNHYITNGLTDLAREHHSFFSDKIEPKLSSEIDSILRKYFWDNGFIPKNYDIPKVPSLPMTYRFPREGDTLPMYSVTTKQHELYDIGRLPKVKGSFAKKIVDDFSFTLFPFDYIIDNPFRNETSIKKTQLIRVVETLKRVFTGKYDLYVIAPIEYFSIENMVKSDINKQIYGGKHSATFQSLIMSLPLLRNFRNEINALKANQQILDNNVSSINSTLEIMKTNIEHIGRTVEEQNRKLVEMKMREEQRIREYEELKQTIALSFTDPMLIAIPSDVTVGLENFEDAECIVGGVWGSDFTSEILSLFNLNLVNGQRAKLEKLLNQF